MALKQSLVISGVGFISSFDVVVKTGNATLTTPPLYIKVESVAGDKANIKAAVTFKDDATGEYVMRKDYNFAPSMDSGNFIAQAYAHLKTLPEFAGATDC